MQVTTHKSESCLTPIFHSPLNCISMQSKISLFIISFLFLGYQITVNSQTSSEALPLTAKVKPVEDIYFGTSITDPYRYMEDLNSDFAEVIVPENPSAPITSFSMTSDGLYYTLSVNGVQEKLYFLSFGSNLVKELILPFTAGNLVLKAKGTRFSDFWVTISGWTSKPQRYRYLPQKDEFRLENLSTPVDFPEFNGLVTEEWMVASHDGVKVPLSIIYKKGISKNGDTPLLIYGYGSYGISMSPMFSPAMLLWAMEGGVLAIAHVRGGGELGNVWYKGGYKTTKPNTWKDLIACTEFMIDEGYTSPENIAIYSGSAGGIMVGRAMTERPDLYAAVIPDSD